MGRPCVSESVSEIDCSTCSWLWANSAREIAVTNDELKMTPGAVWLLCCHRRTSVWGAAAKFEWSVVSSAYSAAASLCFAINLRQHNFLIFSPRLPLWARVSLGRIDNNLTRKVSLTDATWIASMKDVVSSTLDVTLALSLEHHYRHYQSLRSRSG